MTLLVISPDYASHLYPLATLATAWRDQGERVVVATGPATDAVVRSFGYEREQLQLGRGSNPGVIRAEEQPPGEDDSLRGFFAATREGAVAALAFQARARGDDLLWNALGVARAVHDLVDAPNLAEHDLSSLERFCCMGAPIPRAMVREARHRLPGLIVLGHYGALWMRISTSGPSPAGSSVVSSSSEVVSPLTVLQSR